LGRLQGAQFSRFVRRLRRYSHPLLARARRFFLLCVPLPPHKAPITPINTHKQVSVAASSTNGLLPWQAAMSEVRLCCPRRALSALFKQAWAPKLLGPVVLLLRQ
jgi:hypothetical protein